MRESSHYIGVERVFEMASPPRPLLLFGDRPLLLRVGRSRPVRVVIRGPLQEAPDETRFLTTLPGRW